MENENTNIELIFKYLNNEISDKEKDIFKTKLEKDSSFANLFNDFKKLWQLTKTNIDQQVIDIDIEEEWHKFKQNVNSSRPKTSKVIKLNTSWKYAVSIAATIIIFIGLFFFFNNSSKTIKTGSNILTAYLPDSSKIFINRNSAIKYKKNFKENRIVKLTGDAYFKVKHDSSHPFIVETEKYDIEVVGTEFYVNSDSSEFEVIVKKGKVKVYPNKNPQKTILLTPGEKTIIINNKLQKTQSKNDNYIAWKSHKIIFDNIKLSKITKILTKTYGVDIEISDPKLNNLKMTSTFENQSLQSIIKVIEATLNIKIIKQKNKYIVIGKS